jgi:hypothetical protein
MERIGIQRIWSYFDTASDSRAASNQQIRAGDGHPVSSYPELARKIAELQFLNREHVLLFRGQSADYRTSKGESMLKPRSFRLEGGKAPTETILRNRFSRLITAETELVLRYEAKKLLGVERIKRYRVLRWAILQHYEVCPTPLLDVTHSLRNAASFASHDNISGSAYMFVLGVPNLSGAVTSSSEAGLQIIRLSSACPPDAVRPHFQEGYLLGEYPEISDYGKNSHYSLNEMDFGRRLLAKFRFDPQRFWTNPNFPLATRKALYAIQQTDVLRGITLEIAEVLSRDSEESCSRRS